ncbi:hypothetical protein PsYK624_112420 [Phanerochaete sordida]|uniref:Uncharacterized protein n=1 Tax=Phanerochaete sordida TaxID=48140 RepID=A0A9P3GHL0_9APHY|nr:hypothetical protein PsYK624_112420 [Phanerochaete sordida]
MKFTGIITRLQPALVPTIEKRKTTGHHACIMHHVYTSAHVLSSRFGRRLPSQNGAGWLLTGTAQYHSTGVWWKKVRRRAMDGALGAWARHPDVLGKRRGTAFRFTTTLSASPAERTEVELSRYPNDFDPGERAADQDADAPARATMCSQESMHRLNAQPGMCIRSAFVRYPLKLMGGSQPTCTLKRLITGDGGHK